ncbi:MAG TPA: NAD(P)H-binding protein [Methanoregulaceae archaeon]|nr:NAD(P)H-binding protein [Methanoregulaceae archaeon]HRY76428.1 NAD(P)H-binding protein [Methanoregulaceae archaeon]
MHIILGAAGQVGSQVVRNLHRNGEPVTAVIRNKASAVPCDGIETRVADLSDGPALKEIFREGRTVFLLTPENPSSGDVIGGTKKILANYHDAIRDSGIRKIVGLSSMGAQHPAGTGNLVMSYLLEHAFPDIPVQQVFIRPAYYYSNWLGFAAIAQETGVLPSFLPVNLKIPMTAPPDVAGFIASVLTDTRNTGNGTFEIAGPTLYSPSDVAIVFGELFKKQVTAHQIPPEQWKESLLRVGFSDNASDNLILMTQAVIDGRARPEFSEEKVIRLRTSLKEFLSVKL